MGFATKPTNPTDKPFSGDFDAQIVLQCHFYAAGFVVFIELSPINIPRSKAVSIGLGALAFVAILQAFNSVVCYKHDVSSYLGALMFIAIPMLPPIISLGTKNPLRAVGGSLMFAPWLVFAYYTDCVRPYAGGGASMIYVVVVMWGLLTAVVGTVLTGPVLRMFGVSVNEG